MLYHSVARRAEEHATFDSTCTGGRVMVAGSRIVTVVVFEAGGVLGSMTLGLLESWLAFWGLFRPQGTRGGTCCCMVGCPLGKKWLAVMVRRTTISSPGSSALASEEPIDSASTCLTAQTPLGDCSTRICSACPWKTVSAIPSLTGSSDPTLISRGPRSWASLTVNPSGKKPRCRAQYMTIADYLLSKLVQDLGNLYKSECS